MQSFAWLLRNFVKEFPTDKFKLWESLLENFDSTEQVAGSVIKVLKEWPKIPFNFYLFSQAIMLSYLFH